MLPFLEYSQKRGYTVIFTLCTLPKGNLLYCLSDIANAAQIRFLGGKLGAVMAEVYEANTVGDLL